jgi:hypothetical protein
LGDPTGSNATAGLALRVTGTHKPLYHGKVKIPTKGCDYYSNLKALVRKGRGLFHGTVKSFVFAIWCLSVVLLGHWPAEMNAVYKKVNTQLYSGKESG